MKIRKLKIVELIFLLILLFYSCASSRNDRVIKRHSEIIRDSDIIVYAKKESILSTINLQLREHHVFDIYETGMIWEYYSGTWKKSSDTLYLVFFGNHVPRYYSKYAIIDTASNNIEFKFQISNHIQTLYLSYVGKF